MNSDQWPDDYRPQPNEGPFTLTVDGEVFTLRMRPDGGDECTWESGPNEGYGFGGGPVRTLGHPDAEPYLKTIEEHRESIRNFLGMIDPETGYIGWFPARVPALDHAALTGALVERPDAVVPVHPVAGGGPDGETPVR
ncbi:hypothetical protein M1M07_22905 [Rhodococcus sp. HM1]|uniref:hypothetical protein n=1 Tax=Rhodococcus sp. HM1 TaxID=2937759 RepID=UPI00200AA50B|nr:hypothetical protein [Rhodococcus sp. HM1]MCK8673945.1 hypothetical protein [Rhodococcus sp. HM1]